MLVSNRSRLLTSLDFGHAQILIFPPSSPAAIKYGAQYTSGGFNLAPSEGSNLHIGFWRPATRRWLIFIREALLVECHAAAALRLAAAHHFDDAVYWKEKELFLEHFPFIFIITLHNNSFVLWNFLNKDKPINKDT